MVKTGGTNKLKRYLNYVIDSEIQKPISKMDTDKISRCADWFFELDGIEVKIPEEEIKKRAKLLINKYY